MNLTFTLKVVLFWFISFSSVFVGYGQEINGKWIFLKGTETLVIPSTIKILEFDNFQLTEYDFDKEIYKEHITIESNTIYVKDLQVQYKISENEVLELEYPMISNVNRKKYTWQYLRLKGTDTIASPKVLEYKSILFPWNDVNNVISFENSVSTNDFQRGRFKTCNDVRLEQLDSMLFISIYCDNERDFVFPIKEITSDNIKVYVSGINEIKAELIDR